ncbi:MAG: dethiobiotin synthase [Alphaproteobacteria bacterium]|nr:dethiobiotin synthase [Alphaproteobacteria bacterium]
MSQGLFITGAGTEVGKTLIACALAHHLRTAKRPVKVLKPIISGFDPDLAETSDTALLLRAAGVKVTKAAIAEASPWRYAEPISPNMAAARTGTPIDMDAVMNHCRAALSDDALTLIEGVGGVMAPLTDEATVLDWMAALGLPAVVVGGSYLGAMSHTLTAVSVLIERAVPIRAVVVSESRDQPVPLAETASTIAGFMPHLPVIAVPRIAPIERPWEAIDGLGELLED